MERKERKMTYIVEELKKDAKYHKFFWNGLFAALYEDVRKTVSVEGLTTDSGSGYHIYASKSTINSYLSCDKEMDVDCFIEYCKGIKVDIEKKRYMEIVPYVNRAFAYLEEQMATKKCSKSKECRKAVFEEANLSMNENYKVAQENALDNLIGERIIETFSDLSKEELSLLYRVADGYADVCDCDVFFMNHYCCLNDKGKKLFREALEEEQRQKSVYEGDEVCSFYKEMAGDTKMYSRDITPEMLYIKMDEIGYYLLDDAERLKAFRHAKASEWSDLELYHKVMLAYSDEKQEDALLSERESLLIFLCWLEGIPSLKA